jgi:hypothetical protein
MPCWENAALWHHATCVIVIIIIIIIIISHLVSSQAVGWELEGDFAAWSFAEDRKRGGADRIAGNMGLR